MSNRKPLEWVQYSPKRYVSKDQRFEITGRWSALFGQDFWYLYDHATVQRRPDRWQSLEDAQLRAEACRGPAQ